MSYSLFIKKKLKAKPVVIVFGTHAIGGDVSKGLEATEFSFMKQISCKYWAEKCYVLSQSTVGEASEKTAPLSSLMAIAYFFSSQKLSLMSTEYRDDPTLQTLYWIAKEQTDIHVPVEQSTCDVLLEVCNQTNLQFKKILNAFDEIPDTFSKKRLHAYTDDGVLYTQICNHKYSRTSEVLVESMPSPPELPESAKDSWSQVSFNTDMLRDEISLPKTDMNYVKQFIQAKDNTSWKMRFEAGREEGFFSSYANSQSVKTAYFKHLNKQANKWQQFVPYILWNFGICYRYCTAQSLCNRRNVIVKTEFIDVNFFTCSYFFL